MHFISTAARMKDYASSDRLTNVATQLLNWIKGGHQPPFSCLQHYEAELGLEAHEEIGLEGEVKALQSIIEIQVPDQGLINCCLRWQATKVLLKGCLVPVHKPSLVQSMDLRLPLPPDASQAFRQSFLWLSSSPGLLRSAVTCASSHPPPGS